MLDLFVSKKFKVMENTNYKPEGSLNSHPLKKLEEKTITNFQGVALAIKDFTMESQLNTRLGVLIDWSKGTMIIQANK
jgi:hypothetical protein